MKLLLDTHALLWWHTKSSKLSNRVRELIQNPEAIIYMSVASLWEVQIKHQLGRLELPDGLDRLVDLETATNDFRVLDITYQHIRALNKLPLYHRDPFDRILVAQSLFLDVPLATADPEIRPYAIQTVW
jgi:PIN domain nuclease of toxin-antitoxin system